MQDLRKASNRGPWGTNNLVVVSLELGQSGEVVVKPPLSIQYALEGEAFSKHVAGQRLL